MGTGTALARLEQPAPGLAPDALDLAWRAARQLRDVAELLAEIRNVLPRELPHRVGRRIAVRLNAESAADDRRVGAEQGLHLGRRPEVEGAFRLPATRIARGCGVRRKAVGILGRVEAARLVGQVPQHVGQRVLGHLAEPPLARGLPRLEAGQHELGLVVEHLLEVRHSQAASTE